MKSVLKEVQQEQINVQKQLAVMQQTIENDIGKIADILEGSQTQT